MCIEIEENRKQYRNKPSCPPIIYPCQPNSYPFSPLSPSLLFVTLHPLSAEGSSWYQEDYTMGREWTALDPFVSL